MEQNNTQKLCSQQQEQKSIAPLFKATLYSYLHSKLTYFTLRFLLLLSFQKFALNNLMILKYGSRKYCI